MKKEGGLNRSRVFKGVAAIAVDPGEFIGRLKKG